MVILQLSGQLAQGTTLHTAALQMEEQRNREEETLSGETNNVENNTKHWGVSHRV